MPPEYATLGFDSTPKPFHPLWVSFYRLWNMVEDIKLLDIIRITAVVSTSTSWA